VCVKGWKIGQEALETGKSGIIATGDAEADRKLFSGVRLVEGSSQAFIEARFDPLDWPDDGNMGNAWQREG